MKEHPLTEEQVTELLNRSQVGNIATLNEDGYPYTVPVHYIYHDEKIYIHGLPVGEKIKNIQANEKVCFDIYSMKGLILDDAPCDVNTEYESVIILGKAKIITNDYELKEDILIKIVEKYTPHLKEIKLPVNMVKGTGIIEITIKECTGKYYK